MAGWGDPGFDVGSAFSDFVVFELDGAAPDAVRPAAAAFWRAYVRARRLDAPASRRLLERAWRHAGARLVQTAFEHTQETPTMGARVERIVRLAGDLLLDGGAAGARLGIAA